MEVRDLLKQVLMDWLSSREGGAAGHEIDDCPPYYLALMRVELSNGAKTHSGPDHQVAQAILHAARESGIPCEVVGGYPHRLSIGTSDTTSVDVVRFGAALTGKCNLLEMEEGTLVRELALAVTEGVSALEARYGQELPGQSSQLAERVVKALAVKLGVDLGPEKGSHAARVRATARNRDGILEL